MKTRHDFLEVDKSISGSIIEEGEIVDVKCTSCGGSGKIKNTNCEECEGEGHYELEY